MNKIKNKLAFFGGKKVVTKKFKPYNSIGIQELNAVTKVMKSGVLSKYLGAWNEDFFGGPKVQEFERKCASFFGVKHAITVNSWTSGLIAALGAIGIEPGDEVIVSPWTMCASATSILHWNAIPVFADIDPDTFNISPKSIEKNISPFTKAIISIDIFGQSADMKAIMRIAKKYNLKVISDSAQSPGALYNGKYAGTLADIGGISLNYHKHIHTGEGGVLFTNDDKLCERLQLIRNHGEAVVHDKKVKNISNIVGHNFRLGEIESAIGIEQLKKLKKIIRSRQILAERLTKGLKGLLGLNLPKIISDSTHVYYVYPMILDCKLIGVSRKKISNLLKAEGVNVADQYQNIHLLPIFQKKIAYGSKGFPWTSNLCKREINYRKGICPVAEKLNDESYLGFGMCVYDLTEKDIDLIIKAFKKVWSSLKHLNE